MTIKIQRSKPALKKYLKIVFFIFLFILVLSFSALLISSKILIEKHEYLHNFCNEINDESHTLQELEKKTKSYFIREEYLKDSVARIKFSVSQIPFDFTVCIIEYDKSTKKILKHWFNK